MGSLLKSTMRVNSATAMVFAVVLAMGLAPLLAEEPTGSDATKSLSPSTGKGEGVVNVPSMPEENQVQTGAFGANGCRVVTTMTLGSAGVVLQLPSEASTVVASYVFNGVPITTTVQNGQLGFDAASLETLRAEKVEHFDIVLAASENQYVRARVELPVDTDQVTVRIE